MLFLLFFPALVILFLSFSKYSWVRKVLPFTSLTILIPIVMLFIQERPYHLLGDYLVVDALNSYILLVSSIVGIGVTLSLLTLDKRVAISEVDFRRFYRFFGIFWVGLIVSILSNNMGIYWVGLEMATLSTVYMIKTNKSTGDKLQIWSYLIVGTIAISLILFGIILIYASAKPNLGEEAMNFNMLLSNVHSIENGFLFDIGFSIVMVGMFIKMGFFPMNLWLADVERASFYPVAALFSGILESAILIGFFRFSQIAMELNHLKIFIFTLIYVILTIFIVAFLVYRVKDFIRLFTSSGVENMALIVLFWVAGSPFAALLHFGAHAFLKPMLFLSAGILESHGRY
ncbi:MAG: hydrogenase, partial [Epsilonproteobacteria bacterium]|nr:hydrogenase [Campylobacterota bacterium]